MELFALRGFVAVVEEESFTRAAQRVFVTQPAVSMQIKSLEDELGEPLLERDGRKVRLTEAGRILYECAKTALDVLDSAGERIQDLGGLKRGRLSLGCSDTLSTHVLVPILSAFAQQYPTLELTVHNKTSLQIMQLTLSSDLDCGLITLPCSEPGLSVEPLFEYREMAVVCSSHPLAKQSGVALDQLAQHRLLLLERSTKSRMLLEQEFLAAGTDPCATMEVGSVQMQKAFAQIGLGVGIVPEYSLADELRADTLCALNVADLPARQIGLITRSARVLSLAARTFIDILRERFRAQDGQSE